MAVEIESAGGNRSRQDAQERMEPRSDIPIAQGVMTEAEIKAKLPSLHAQMMENKHAPKQDPVTVLRDEVLKLRNDAALQDRIAECLRARASMLEELLKLVDAHPVIAEFSRRLQDLPNPNHVR